MHVVVVGCGRVGSELAASWRAQATASRSSTSGSRPSARLPSSFSGVTIDGFGFDRDTLAEAGIERAGAFAAVTSGDNSNIMSARVARETFEVERVVARIYDPRRAVIYQRLGIPTVATVSWTTDQVMRRLLPDTLAADWVDASGKVSLVERELPAPWAGKRIADLVEPGAFNLAAVTRLGTAQIPRPDLVGQEGDILHFVVATDALELLNERLTGLSEGAH